MEPIAIGTLVFYHGSLGTHAADCPNGLDKFRQIADQGKCKGCARYVVTAHHDPEKLFSAKELEKIAEAYPSGGLAERYPDGVAYEIWPEGMEPRIGLREYMVYRVKRSSLTVVTAGLLCTREPFEPMEPFTEEI